MKIITFIKIIIPSFLIGTTFNAIAAPTTLEKSSFNATGYWLTALAPGKDGTDIHEAKIEIYNCGSNICGKIFSLKEPIDIKTGKPPVDEQNPDEQKRSTPIIGMQFIFDMAPDKEEPNKWSGGTIYAGDRGKTYTAYITMPDNDNLHLRGYVLGMPLLGRTTIWTRTTKDAKF